MSELNLISEATIGEVRAISLVEVASAVTQLRRVGSRLVGLCPLHSERHPSFGISIEKNLFYCHGCNAGGDTISFIQEIEHCDFRTAVGILAQRFDIPLEAGPFDAKRFAMREELREVNRRIQNLQRHEAIRLATILDRYRKEIRAYEHPDDVDPNIYDRLRRADAMYVLSVLADEDERLAFLSSSDEEQQRRIDLVLMDGCFSKWELPLQ